MKKIILIAAAVLLSAGWIIRFSIVNEHVDVPAVQIYEKGAEAPIGKDFFDYGDEEMDGYTVTVLDAELLSTEAFLQRYDAADQAEKLGTFTDYLYVVRVSVANHDNPYTGEKGIDLRRYVLQGTNYTLSFEETCCLIANPSLPGSSFSLKKGTDMELTLPFDVMSQITSKEHLQNDPPKLQISQYPNQKLLRLSSTSPARSAKNHPIGTAAQIPVTPIAGTAARP